MKMLTMLMTRVTSLDAWDMNSYWTDQCRTLLVKATSFSCTSIQCSDKPRQIFGHYAKTVISSQIWPDIITSSLKVVGCTTQLIGNCLLSSCYPELLYDKFWIATCMNVSGTSLNVSAFEHMHEYFCILSIMSDFWTWRFSKKPL